MGHTASHRAKREVQLPWLLALNLKFDVQVTGWCEFLKLEGQPRSGLDPSHSWAFPRVKPKEKEEWYKTSKSKKRERGRKESKRRGLVAGFSIMTVSITSAPDLIENADLSSGGPSWDLGLWISISSQATLLQPVQSLQSKQ